MKKINVIITGATGMVGEGVLLECLELAQVESVLVINRKSIGLSHPKLKEVIHTNLQDITPIEKFLSGYNACFFCLGTTSLGKKGDEYYQTTYTLTMHIAQVLCKLNTDMTFCYISGAGTDSTEKGKIAWARVKGKTENDLMKLPFQQVFALRPGFIKAAEGQKRAHKFYKYVNWLFPIGRSLFPAGFCTMKELAYSMVNATLKGYHTQVLEGKDIIRLANVEKE